MAAWRSVFSVARHISFAVIEAQRFRWARSGESCPSATGYTLQQWRMYGMSIVCTSTRRRNIFTSKWLLSIGRRVEKETNKGRFYVSARSTDSVSWVKRWVSDVIFRFASPCFNGMFIGFMEETTWVCLCPHRQQGRQLQTLHNHNYVPWSTLFSISDTVRDNRAKSWYHRPCGTLSTSCRIAKVKR